MNNWIKHPVQLSGKLIDLIPLEKVHFQELYSLAKDQRISEFLTYNLSLEEQFIRLYDEALVEREKGNHYPFVIVLKKEKKIIGSTRFFEIQAKDRKLEIGWTWLHPDYWASGINTDCKYLMLEFCFEVLKTVRVQLRTSDTNIRSRKAIEKLGAQYEGLFRKDKIRDNGTTRNSIYFSIIDDEWEQVKKKLLRKIEI